MSSYSPREGANPIPEPRCPRQVVQTTEIAMEGASRLNIRLTQLVENDHSLRAPCSRSNRSMNAFREVAVATSSASGEHTAGIVIPIMRKSLVASRL